MRVIEEGPEGDQARMDRQCGSITSRTAATVAPDAHDEWVAKTVQALKNVGVDTECGACMEVAFTGVTTNVHECEPVIGDLLAALKGLRALILGECGSAYECIDGERADAAIAKAEGREA